MLGPFLMHKAEKTYVLVNKAFMKLHTIMD